MKTIILTLLLSLSANASFFAITCSNSDATVTMQSGHIQPKITLTEEDFRNNSRVKSVYKFSEIIQTDSEEVEINREHTVHCQPGSRAGYATWSTTSSKKVVLTKADGTKFPKNTVGLSDDGYSISTYLICENKGNSRAGCN